MRLRMTRECQFPAARLVRCSGPGPGGQGLFVSAALTAARVVDSYLSLAEVPIEVQATSMVDAAAEADQGQCHAFAICATRNATR